MFFIIIFFICIALLILILLIKVKVTIKAKNNFFTVTVEILKILKLRLNFLIKRQKKEIYSLYKIKKKYYKRITSLKKILQDSKKKKLTDRQKLAAKKALKFLYQKTRLKINLVIDAGLYNAYATAMLCGALKSAFLIAGSIYNTKMHSINIRINPQFAKQIFSLKANCIIELTPANIIFGFIIYKKNKAVK